jgi:hypothetical protein
MSRPRFLTAMAVSAAVCDGLEDKVAADHITPAHLVFEWLLVEGFVRAGEKENTVGTPGTLKGQAAKNSGQPLSAGTYLRVPSIFGFHGVYKRSGPRPIRALVSGWAISIVSRYQSGFPSRISGGTATPLFSGQRPNRVLGVDPRTGVSRSDFDPATSLYYNKAAYTSAGPYTFGNAPPQDPKLRGWAFYNEDLAVLKRVQIHENVNFRLGAQFYNIFNRTVFTDPTANLNSLTLGMVGGQSNFPRQMQFTLRLGL